LQANMSAFIASTSATAEHIADADAPCAIFFRKASLYASVLLRQLSTGARAELLEAGQAFSMFAAHASSADTEFMMEEFDATDCPPQEGALAFPPTVSSAISLAALKSSFFASFLSFRLAKLIALLANL